MPQDLGFPWGELTNRLRAQVLTEAGEPVYSLLRGIRLRGINSRESLIRCVGGGQGWFPRRWCSSCGGGGCWWRVTPGLKREGGWRPGLSSELVHRSAESGNGNPPSGQPRAADPDASLAARPLPHPILPIQFLLLFFSRPSLALLFFGTPHTVTTPSSAAG